MNRRIAILLALMLIIFAAAAAIDWAQQTGTGITTFQANQAFVQNLLNQAANNANATKLQGRAINVGAPTNGYGLFWSSANSDWEPSTPGAFGAIPGVFSSLSANGATAIYGWADPRSYGAQLKAVSFSTSVTAGSTTLTDSVNQPFTSSMNRIKLFAAKHAPDWSASHAYNRDAEIQPALGNAGNYIYIQTANSCTSGGTEPGTWNQTTTAPNNTTTDGTCTWLNLSITALSYVTTLTYVSPSQVTLGLAPDVTGTVTYTAGTDDTAAINSAIAAAQWQNGSGRVVLPCGTVTFVSTINVGTPPSTSSHAVELSGCGYGSSYSTNNQIGDVLIYDGPGATPIIKTAGGFGFRIHDLRLVSNQYTPASACIDLDNPLAGPAEEEFTIYNIWCGNRGNFPDTDTIAQVQNGIVFTPVTGGGNNGPGNFWNLRIGGWTDWAIDIPGSQFVNNSFENVQANGQGLIYEKGAYRIGAAQTVFVNNTFEQVGTTAIDMLPTGSGTFIGNHAELTQRLFVCDMNQGSQAFGGGSDLIDTIFQLDTNYTASDAKIVDCDQTAPGGIVTGNYSIRLRTLQLTQSGTPFTGTPLIALGSSSTTASNYDFRVDVNGTSAVTPANFAATTNALNNHAIFCLNDVTRTTGRRAQCIDVTGSGGSIATAPLNEIPHASTFDASVVGNQIPAFVSGGSACTVVNSGASTCKYEVSLKDPNGETTPVTAGAFTCSSSAALGSQDNKIHFFPPGKGESEYCLYGDDCAGGAYKLLSGVANAGADNCVSRDLVDTSSTYPQITFEDNHLTRTGTSPAATNTTGMLIWNGPAKLASLQFSQSLTSLGGGAAPTFGTIGGSGPATAAQNSWLKLTDSSGASFWVPVWK